MYLEAMESAHHAVSEFLNMDILSVWARMMACDTEWRAVDKNIADDVLSNCALFILVTCVLNLILRPFFITLVGVLR